MLVHEDESASGICTFKALEKLVAQGAAQSRTGCKCIWRMKSGWSLGDHISGDGEGSFKKFKFYFLSCALQLQQAEGCSDQPCSLYETIVVDFLEILKILASLALRCSGCIHPFP